MTFFKNILKSDKKNVENDSENTTDKSSEFGLGEFDINDYPENSRNKCFYFYDYDKPNGEWIEIGEPICVIRIGEKSGFTFTSASIIASKSGILEHTLKKDDCFLMEKFFTNFIQKENSKMKIR